MITPRAIAENAFRLYEQKSITREELVQILQECVNIAASENDYADEHGLPFKCAEEDGTRGP